MKKSLWIKEQIRVFLYFEQCSINFHFTFSFLKLQLAHAQACFAFSETPSGLTVDYHILGIGQLIAQLWAVEEFCWRAAVEIKVVHCCPTFGKLAR